ncbi:MAG: DEAD/DEAH box helicase [archaeon]|nr:DEAD/DEAH box helicase [archaeon]
MPFEGLSCEVASVLEDRGITEPTEPQAGAIPKIAKGVNVLIVAPTGTGKTEAAMLPVFDAILSSRGKPGIRCVYVSPLRSLNRDVLLRIRDYGEALGISVGVRHGDTVPSERNKQALHPPEILITTPETLQLLLIGSRLSEHLRHVEWFIVDEIHELAFSERGAQMSVAMERLFHLAGEYQRIGLSATVSDVNEVARFLVGAERQVTVCKYDTYRDFSIEVECANACSDSELLDKLRCEPYILGAICRIKELIEKGNSTLLFVNTREAAEWMVSRYHLLDECFSIDIHHGSLSKEDRICVEDKFKEGELRAIICTSSLELGIDIGTVDLVIQYNSPRQVSRMIQRAGRAGHCVNRNIKAKIIAISPDDVAEALVIARRASVKKLEKKVGRENPLTVVANQLVAMTMRGSITRDQAYTTFRRTHIFRNLDRKEMDNVVEQLKSIKMVFEDKNGFRRSKKGMKYFYSNISMIPDERTYTVRNIVTRRVIGTLDESFVAAFINDCNSMFIMRGHTWRVIEVHDCELLVGEAKEIGSVPSWTGSDIPVPFEIAMEVGKLRRMLNLDDYPGNSKAKKCVSDFVIKQGNYVVPTDETITIEIGEKIVIINACFGTRVNETLGKIYSALLMARIGESIGVSIDPYRIMLELPRNVSEGIIVELIPSVKPGTVEDIVKIIIGNSTFLKWRFVYVAKKFGIVDKDADYSFMNFKRLLDIHKNTPVYNEAINKVLWEDLDIANTERVVSAIANNSIKICVTPTSPIGMEGIVKSRELMQPTRATHSILVSLKKRLENEIFYSLCLNCHLQWRVRVCDVPEQFVCQRCGGTMIAILKEYERDLVKLFAKRELTDLDKKQITHVRKIASLVNENGKLACMVLAARGIGPHSASKILRTLHADDDEFLMDILSAEVTFAKNKRFWD